MLRRDWLPTTSFRPAMLTPAMLATLRCHPPVSLTNTLLCQICLCVKNSLVSCFFFCEELCDTSRVCRGDSIFHDSQSPVTFKPPSTRQLKHCWWYVVILSHSWVASSPTLSCDCWEFDFFVCSDVSSCSLTRYWVNFTSHCLVVLCICVSAVSSERRSLHTSCTIPLCAPSVRDAQRVVPATNIACVSLYDSVCSVRTHHVAPCSTLATLLICTRTFTNVLLLRHCWSGFFPELCVVTSCQLHSSSSASTLGRFVFIFCMERCKVIGFSLFLQTIEFML